MILPPKPYSEPLKKNVKLPRRPSVRPSDKPSLPPRLFRCDYYFAEGLLDFRSGSQKRSRFQLTLWSWMSALIDGLVLVSSSCFTMILFSVLMRTQARDLLKFFLVESNILKMFMVFFGFSFWVYLIMMRIFMGASLGEWSCQLRLGQPVQRIKTSYILRVMARTTLILVTGIITLPILSIVCKKDLIGDLTGLRIYSLT